MKRDRTLTKHRPPRNVHVKAGELPYVPIGRGTALSMTTMRHGRKDYKSTPGSRAADRGHEYGQTCKMRWSIPGRPLAGVYRRRTEAMAVCRRMKLGRLPVLVDASLL